MLFTPAQPFMQHSKSAGKAPLTLRGLAHIRGSPRFLRTRIVFYDPLCAEEDLAALIDEFLTSARGHHVGFWKASQQTVAVVAERGFRIVGYGVDHEVPVPVALSGSAMRGLRRQVDKARKAGVAVTPLPAAEATSPIWRELEDLDARWLSSRALATRPFSIRRVTRRYARRRVEPHTTL